MKTARQATRLPRIERKLDALAQGIALLSVGIALSFDGVHAALEGKRKKPKRDKRAARRVNVRGD